MFAATIIDASGVAPQGGTVLALTDITGTIAAGQVVDLASRERMVVGLDGGQDRVAAPRKIVVAPPLTATEGAALRLHRIATAGLSPADGLAERHPGAMPTAFGDGPELSAQLLDLIRQGRKTGTCGALRHYEEDGDPIPREGELYIARNWDGSPALVYEVTEVRICRFDEVTEAFALSEGEGDFDDWTRGHTGYFSRNGGFTPDMQIVCESFRLREVLT